MGVTYLRAKVAEKTGPNKKVPLSPFIGHHCWCVFFNADLSQICEQALIRGEHSKKKSRINPPTQCVTAIQPHVLVTGVHRLQLIHVELSNSYASTLWRPKSLHRNGFGSVKQFLSYICVMKSPPPIVAFSQWIKILLATFIRAFHNLLRDYKTLL
jgi:hypothetical protein